MKRGYNVVPRHMSGGKHPAVFWKEFQERAVTMDELLGWYAKFAGGLGFITGAISRTIVIETDGPVGDALIADFERQYGPLPTTLTIRSGSGRGVHRHYKHPGRRVKTQANSKIQLDIKGDGGFCVLPPSKHKSGAYYEIVRDTDPAELPNGFLEFIEAKAAESKEQTSRTGLGHGVQRLMNPGRSSTRGRGEVAGNLIYQRPPVNAVNVARIQSMLNALPDAYATEFGSWLRIGFALHYFDDCEVGLALWKSFSERCPDKAKDTDFKRLWAGFGRDYVGDKITLGWLTAQAQAHGWIAPCRWDYSTMIAS
jgi:hypothetical protein